MTPIKPALMILMALPLAAAVLIPAGAGEPGGQAEQPRKHPNLLVDVSSTLIDAVVKQSVDRTEPVEEVIQETPVRGIGRTVGTVRAELVPEADVAVLEIVLEGVIYSDSVGTRPHVLMTTTSTTVFDVRQRIIIGPKGMLAVPQRPCARASITLLDVKSRREPDAIAMCVAEKIFYAGKPDSEAESAMKAGQKLAKGFADELAPTLATTSQAVGRGLQGVNNAGITLDYMAFQTTADALQARLRFAVPGGNGPGPAPLLPTDIALGVRVHQSFLNEAAQSVLGGRTFSLADVRKFYGEFAKGYLRGARNGVEPKADLTGVEKTLASLGIKAASITLAAKDPITVSLEDQEFTGELHIASVTLNEKVYAGQRVKVAYKLESSPEGVVAVRKGLPKFIPVVDKGATKKLEPIPMALQLLLEVVFAELLKERLVLTGLPVPDFIAGQMQGPRVGIRDGWVALGWKMAEQTKK